MRCKTIGQIRQELKLVTKERDEALLSVIRLHTKLLQHQWVSMGLTPPPEGDPFLAYHPDWVDLDFNPKGVRECHRYGDGSAYLSAKWLDEQDCWVECYMEPTHWMPYPDSPI